MSEPEMSERSRNASYVLGAALILLGIITNHARHTANALERIAAALEERPTPGAPRVFRLQKGDTVEIPVDWPGHFVDSETHVYQYKAASSPLASSPLSGVATGVVR